jgi:two-component system chemotaxis response regulator CheB
MTMPPCERAIVIGASAGALEALSAILPALPEDFPAAVLIVVHLPPDKDSVLVSLLDSKCRLPVREAEDKECLEPGVVYCAPPDYHLLVETDRRLSLSSEEPVHYSRPSIDVLFMTAADAFRENLIGVVLTGANSDGAEGLQAIERAGGTALAQRPDTAQAPQMPSAALALCSHANALTLGEIAKFLCEAVNA